MNENGNVESMGGWELVAEKDGSSPRLGVRSTVPDAVDLPDRTIGVSPREARAYAKQILSILGPEEDDDPEAVWMGSADSTRPELTRIMVEYVIGDDVERAEHYIEEGTEHIYAYLGHRIVSQWAIGDDGLRSWAQVYDPESPWALPPLQRG